VLVVGLNELAMVGLVVSRLRGLGILLEGLGEISSGMVLWVQL